MKIHSVFHLIIKLTLYKDTKNDAVSSFLRRYSGLIERSQNTLVYSESKGKLAAARHEYMFNICQSLAKTPDSVKENHIPLPSVDTIHSDSPKLADLNILNGPTNQNGIPSDTIFSSMKVMHKPPSSSNNLGALSALRGPLVGLSPNMVDNYVLPTEASYLNTTISSVRSSIFDHSHLVSLSADGEQSTADIVIPETPSDLDGIQLEKPKLTVDLSDAGIASPLSTVSFFDRSADLGANKSPFPVINETPNKADSPLPVDDITTKLFPEELNTSFPLFTAQSDLNDSSSSITNVNKSVMDSTPRRNLSRSSSFKRSSSKGRTISQFSPPPVPLVTSTSPAVKLDPLSKSYGMFGGNENVDGDDVNIY